MTPRDQPPIEKSYDDLVQPAITAARAACAPAIALTRGVKEDPPPLFGVAQSNDQEEG